MSSRGVMSANLGLPPPLGCFFSRMIVSLLASICATLATGVVAILALMVLWKISYRFFFSADTANLCLHSVLVFQCEILFSPLFDGVKKAAAMYCVSLVVDALYNETDVFEFVRGKKLLGLLRMQRLLEGHLQVGILPP